MKCIVIDDEPLALSILEEYVSKTPFLSLKGTYRTGVLALDYLRHQPVDLVFCDINMPDLNGIQVAKLIGPRAQVIFTTAYSEHALVGYELDVIDYLLKPIEFDRFLKAAEKAFRLHEYKISSTAPPTAFPTSETPLPSNPLIRIKSGTQHYQLPLHDILYLEAEGNYVSFVMPNKKLLSLMTMGAAEELLPKDQFLRVHKSFIVACKHISVIEAHELQVKGTKIPIGKSYLQVVRQALGV